MTDKDIERRLADALAKSAPDDVEDVMYRCRSSVSSDSKGTVIPLNMAEKNINVNNNVKKKRLSLFLLPEWRPIRNHQDQRDDPPCGSA